MRPRKLVVLGASNAYWEVRELIDDINGHSRRYDIIAVLDDQEATWGRDLDGVPVVGPLETASEYADDVRFVFAIGSHRTRLTRHAVLDRIGLPEARYETLVHPAAKVFSTASLGPGCIVHFGSVIFNHTKIESFVVVSALSVIATDNLLGRGALLGSGVMTTHLTSIGCFAHVGQGALVGEGIEIGAGAQIGMGSVVLQNVKSGVFALGNPLRFIDRKEVPPKIVNEWESSKRAFSVTR